jgi:hypothetical protein
VIVHPMQEPRQGAELTRGRSYLEDIVASANHLTLRLRRCERQKTVRQMGKRSKTGTHRRAAAASDEGSTHNSGQCWTTGQVRQVTESGLELPDQRSGRFPARDHKGLESRH